MDTDGLRRWTEDEFRNVARGLNDFDTLFNPTPRGYIGGLVLSTAGASATFTCAAGVARDSTNVGDLVLTAALAKTTAAWVVGAGNGSFDGTGAGPSATAFWYHVHLIKRLDTGIVDVLTSLSATAPTLPAGYNLFRRIGSLQTNGVFQWIKFIQDGDVFTWDAPLRDVSVVNPGIAAVTRALSTPLGIRTQAYLGTGFVAATPATDNPGQIFLSDLSIADTVPQTAPSFMTFSSPSQGAATIYVFTNTNSQIRSRIAISTAGTTFFINTMGWIDRRGKDA